MIEFTGRVWSTTALKTGVRGDGSVWTMSTVVVREDGGDYPNSMVFELWGDDISKAPLGKLVTITAECHARRFEDARKGTEYWTNRLRVVDIKTQDTNGKEEASDGTGCCVG